MWMRLATMTVRQIPVVEVQQLRLIHSTHISRVPYSMPGPVLSIDGSGCISEQTRLRGRIQ